tara:strand:- start:12789 stop:13199 length:411 start_codon:yes stop_codon:yes gene_type:complete
MNTAKTILPLLAAFLFIAPLANAQQKPQYSHRLKSQADAEKVEKGSIAMACSKCQTILVRDADKKKTFLEWFKADTEHACPGCDGKMRYNPVAQKTGQPPKYVHTCSNCGDDSAFCCSTTPGKKTPGMTKKEKKTE